MEKFIKEVTEVIELAAKGCRDKNSSPWGKHQGLNLENEQIHDKSERVKHNTGNLPMQTRCLQLTEPNLSPPLWMNAGIKGTYIHVLLKPKEF